jgi:hypothetical protein
VNGNDRDTFRVCDLRNGDGWGASGVLQRPDGTNIYEIVAAGGGCEYKTRRNLPEDHRFEMYVCAWRNGEGQDCTFEEDVYT